MNTRVQDNLITDITPLLSSGLMRLHQHQHKSGQWTSTSLQNSANSFIYGSHCLRFFINSGKLCWHVPVWGWWHSSEIFFHQWLAWLVERRHHLVTSGSAEDCCSEDGWRWLVRPGLASLRWLESSGWVFMRTEWDKQLNKYYLWNSVVQITDITENIEN